MKKKKLLALIITAGVSVLMIAGYLIYTALSGGEKDVAKTVLFSADGIQEISYSYQGEQLSFVKENGEWVYAPDEDFPLNTAYIGDMEEALTSVFAVGEIESGDPAEYGLDKPVCSIKAVASNGSMFECEVGSDNDTANIVYVRSGGSIYMLDMSFSKKFRHTLVEMAQLRELLDIEASEANAFSLVNAQGSIELLHYPEGIPGGFKKLTWALENGSPADAEQAKILISAVADMRAAACVGYKPDAAALASYGLDEPSATVAISYDGGEITAQIGNQNEDGFYYVWLPDSGTVCTFEAATPEMLIKTGEVDCINRQVFPVEFDGLTAAVVEAGGTAVQLDFDEDGKAWDFYYSLSSMRAEGLAETEPAGEADVVVTVHTADPGVTYILAFKKYNDDFYSTSFLGYGQLVNKRDVEELLNILQA
jgi:hypothetical protein